MTILAQENMTKNINNTPKPKNKVEVRGLSSYKGGIYCAPNKTEYYQLCEYGKVTKMYFMS